MQRLHWVWCVWCRFKFLYLPRTNVLWCLVCHKMFGMSAAAAATAIVVYTPYIHTHTSTIPSRAYRFHVSWYVHASQWHLQFEFSCVHYTLAVCFFSFSPFLVAVFCVCVKVRFWYWPTQPLLPALWLNFCIIFVVIVVVVVFLFPGFSLGISKTHTHTHLGGVTVCSIEVRVRSRTFKRKLRSICQKCKSTRAKEKKDNNTATKTATWKEIKQKKEGIGCYTRQAHISSLS